MLVCTLACWARTVDGVHWTGAAERLIPASRPQVVRWRGDGDLLALV